tara:strand:+ start:1621 stop:1752 length:132 start_codon:yes stop_codon:yes gene_type:complete
MNELFAIPKTRTKAKNHQTSLDDFLESREVDQQKEQRERAEPT